MATNEDILSSRILGFIEPQGINARVDVIGFKAPNNDYEILDNTRKRNIFYPEGFVFAPKFQFEQSNISPNSFIEFNVIQSQKEEVSYKDDRFVVNYHSSIPVKQKSFTRIISINEHTALEDGFLVQDEIFPLIQNKNIESIQGSFFLKFQNNLYGLFKYDENSKTIKPKSGKQTNEYNLNEDYLKGRCYNFEGKEYFVGNPDQLGNPVRSIDCMSDEQLADWFKERMEAVIKSEPFLELKKDNYKIFSQHFKAVDDEKLEETRLERIKGKINTLEYNFYEIKELLEPNSTLTQHLKSTILDMRDDFRAEWAKNLQNEKAQIQSEIAELRGESNKIKSEKENFETELSKLKSDFNVKSEILQNDFDEKKKKLENSLSETERKYNAIKANYDLIVESIKLQTSLKSQPITEFVNLEPVIFEAKGETFSHLEENEGYSFNSLLRKNLKSEDLSEILTEQLNRESELFSYKACFIPSVSWAYFYAKALRNVRLYTIHVEHDWLHFKDFINNGILDVLKSCDENKDVNHILVFDSLNLTQPECGLKPLLDAISGYSLILPVFNKPLPNNLKIFATILPFCEENKIGLPLNKDSFVNWGQISNPEDKLTLSAKFMDFETQTGYFEPKDLEVHNIQPKEWSNNGYFAE